MNQTRLASALVNVFQIPYLGDNALVGNLPHTEKYYKYLGKLSLFGLSDHVTIEVKSKNREIFPIIKSIIKSRDLRPRTREAVGTYIDQVDVQGFVRSVESCEEKVTMLETIINIGLYFILPLRKIAVLSHETPWVTSSLKDLIKRRQVALNRRNTRQLKYLINQVI